MKKGDSVGAIKAKRAQLIQNQLARQAVEVHKEYDKALKLFKMVFRSDEKLSKTRNMDLVNAARSILSACQSRAKERQPVRLCRSAQKI